MDAFTRAARRSLRRLGTDVTLVNGTNFRRDDRNDPEWDDDQTATVAELVYRGSPSFASRADGVSKSIDVLAWVDESDPVTDGADDDQTRATRIDLQNETYVVRDTFDEHNGLVRCHCVKEGA